MPDNDDLDILVFRCEPAVVEAVKAVARVHEADSAEAAIALLRRVRCDAAVVDNVGFGGGAAFLKMLRDPAGTPAPGLPVIGLMGQSRPEQIQHLVRRGVDQVMIKPVSAASLLQLARQLRAEGTSQVQTGSYTGPDRRRVSLGDHQGPDRRQEQD